MAFTCAKAETDSCNVSLLANFFTVTMKVLCQRYKYGLLFAEYVPKFKVKCLLILLLCTLQAPCLLQQPEKQNHSFEFKLSHAVECLQLPAKLVFSYN